MNVPTVNGHVVLLPGHLDHDLCTPTFHYHRDPKYGGYSNEAEIGDVVWVEMDGVEGVSDYKIRGVPDVKWLVILRQGYKSPQACGVCPHRGLTSGTKRCPGHGLPVGVTVEDVTIEARSNVVGILGSTRLMDTQIIDCGILVEIGPLDKGCHSFNIFGVWPGNELLVHTFTNTLRVGDNVKLSLRSGM